MRLKVPYKFSTKKSPRRNYIFFSRSRKIHSLHQPYGISSLYLIIGIQKLKLNLFKKIYKQIKSELIWKLGVLQVKAQSHSAEGVKRVVNKTKTNSLDDEQYLEAFTTRWNLRVDSCVEQATFVLKLQLAHNQWKLGIDTTNSCLGG